MWRRDQSCVFFSLVMAWFCHPKGLNCQQQVLQNQQQQLQQQQSYNLDTIQERGLATANSQLQDIQVQCERDAMKVTIKFNTPFNGIVFSKGFYSDLACVHVKPNSGANSAVFVIAKGSCGLTSSGNPDAYGQPNPSGTFVQNTIVIQYDPQVQEVWDQARRLKCTWYDFYEKSVTFKPFSVNRLNAVTANFLGDSLQCWMQIQSGKGPWAGEVSGIVKIGQTMTMVLGIKDEDEKFDMLVRNCVAHDGKRSPIQLVDDRGCIQRPKIMSSFQKIKHFGSSASVVSYAYFQAFKFPDSMNVHFQCVIQVCRFSCPTPECISGNANILPPASNLETYSIPVSGNLASGSLSINRMDEFTVPSSVGLVGPESGRFGESNQFNLPQSIGLGSNSVRQQPQQSNNRLRRSEPLELENMLKVTVKSDMGVLDSKDLQYEKLGSSNESFIGFESSDEHIICATVNNHHGLTIIFLLSTFAASILISVGNGIRSCCC
ncbi:cuticlin-4-like [Tigriopus californicus]|uniref:cuticlin-4-like n=1 Tax=Tigriopus californicus TaxID=6832 RepID=UPI0027D9FD09|nr:cuticlin-4-like [Tigriopus californicus]